MCSQEAILTLRMKNMWSFISYLGRVQPPLSIVLLFLSRSISPQGMNLQLLYPLGVGASTSCLSVNHFAEIHAC